MRILGGHPQGELTLAVVPLGERGPRLDRVGDEAVVAQVDLDLVRRRGKSGSGFVLVAEGPVECEVARHVVVHQRCPRLGRLARIGHGA